MEGKLESVRLHIMSYLGGTDVRIWAEDGALWGEKEEFGVRNEFMEKTALSVSPEEFGQKLEAIDIPGWKKSYEQEGFLVMDGTSWEVTYCREEEKDVKRSGENEYPKNWKAFIRLLKKTAGDFYSYGN
ncbi:MAG: hypothetical protein IKS07_07195 [Lachnospiraceae bacterium]|nr:hypothetical protein [Lachnospiraceae bacterium]